MNKLTGLAVSAAILLGTSAVAIAETYPAATWLPPTNPVSVHGYDNFNESVNKDTNGSVNFEIYHSGSLLPAKTTLQGVADGAAVVGPIYPGYTPAELPVNYLMNDVSFNVTDFFAAALAYSELAMTHPRVMAEWLDKGVVFGGAYATATYGIGCMKPVNTKADLASQKIRSAGGAQGAWVEGLGGVPVSVPIGDVYSGLERGSIDCVLTDPTNVHSATRFGEVIKAYNYLRLGTAIGANWVYDLDFWRGLDPSERRVLLDNMGRAIVDIEATYTQGVQDSMAWMAENDVTVTEPEGDLAEYTDQFKGEHITNLKATAASERGVENPDELIDAFIELQEKWIGLLEGVDRTDNESLYTIVDENLYGTLDENTFGMN